MKRREALLGLTSLAAATAAAGNGVRAQGKESWDQVVAAAKKEGVLVWSFFGAPGAATERQAKEFEQLYGIKVELAPGRDQSFGTLPAVVEPGVPWILDPLVDVKAGNGHTLMTTCGGYFILVNNKLCPPAGGPRSYKDLEGPKIKGPLVLSQPIGAPPGAR